METILEQEATIDELIEVCQSIDIIYSEIITRCEAILNR